MHTGIHGSHGKNGFSGDHFLERLPATQNMRFEEVSSWPSQDCLKTTKNQKPFKKKTNFKTSDGSWQYSQALLSDFQIRKTVTVCPEQDLVN